MSNDRLGYEKWIEDHDVCAVNGFTRRAFDEIFEKVPLCEQSLMRPDEEIVMLSDLRSTMNNILLKYNVLFENDRKSLAEFVCINRSCEISANDYQIMALETLNKTLSKEQVLMNGVLGMTGESGECADLIKKHLFQGHDLDNEHMMRELGDVLWYVAITANTLGYSLNDVMRANVFKLQSRYPNGFESEKSLDRKDGDV